MRLKDKKKLLEMEIKVYELHLSRQKESINKQAELYRDIKLFEIDKEISIKKNDALKENLPAVIDKRILKLNSEILHLKEEKIKQEMLLKFKNEQIDMLKGELKRIETIIEKVLSEKSKI